MTSKRQQGPMDEHSSAEVATAAPIVALTLLLVVGAIALGALRAHAHEIPHLS
jgi:Tfp pilus assembly protein PilX